MPENQETQRELGPESWEAYYSAEAEFKTFDPAEHPATPLRVDLPLKLLRGVDHIDGILDIGCGEGYLLAALRRRYGGSIAGLDISETRLARARDNCPGGSFALGDVRALPYPDGAVDLVSAVEVIEHIDPVEAALAEMARVSRRYVLVSVPFERPPQVVLCPHCLKTFPIDGHVNEFTTRKLQDLMRAAGVVPIETIEYRAPSRFSQLPFVRVLPGFVRRGLESFLVRTSLMARDIPKYIGVLGELENTRVNARG
jgi:SAM-dependent methyltransferase